MITPEAQVILDNLWYKNEIATNPRLVIADWLQDLYLGSGRDSKHAWTMLTLFRQLAMVTGHEDIAKMIPEDLPRLWPWAEVEAELARREWEDLHTVWPKQTHLG